MNLEQAQKMDEILYIIDEINGYTVDQDIAERMSITLTEVEDMLSIINTIKFNGFTLIDYNLKKGTIHKKYDLKPFFEAGGCVALYQKELKNQKDHEELQKLEKQKLLNDIATFKITKSQYQWTIGIAILSLLISLASIIIQILN